MIQNPVLPGFHPDPSFLRVGEDYYLATSTFEWFPGVPIHHSRDMVHWRLLTHALTDRKHLDLVGVLDSAGVWAPSLSYADGLFWLVYSVVRHRVNPFKDLDNFLITSPSIEGPWSDPIYLNSSGFDASLFHDEDGRKWIVGIQWDPRKDRPRFAGILLQEYDVKSQRLIGDATTILQKDTLIEGPNLYQRDGWYYVMLAEGGTGWNHSISMARSRTLLGPYELDPHEAVLTCRDDPSLTIQKAGHGEVVSTPDGRWFLAHLGSRPVGSERRCVLGRETCIQEVTWDEDDWLRLKEGGAHPQVFVPGPDVPPCPWPVTPARDDFDSEVLDPEWVAPRVPIEPSWASLTTRPGWLRLRGRESLHSPFEQSMLARRLTTTECVVTTLMEFEPSHFSQAAGLVCWYDTRTHYFLRVSHDEKRGKILGIVLTDDGAYDELTEHDVSIEGWGQVHLRAELRETAVQFSASPDSLAWQQIGPHLDLTKLSDDYGAGLHFTGAFVGIRCEDGNSRRAIADFDYFEVRTSA